MTQKNYHQKKEKYYQFLSKKIHFILFGLANNKEIDQINILNATIISMKRALEKFEDFNNKIKIDGQKIFDYNQQTFFVKKGGLKFSIYSLSINTGKNFSR